MGLKNTWHPAVQLDLLAQDKGEAFVATHENARPGESRLFGLMERVVQDSNIHKAAKRVIENRGGPGVDGMEVHQLERVLKTDWPRLKKELLAGTYHPHPIKRSEVPKASGGTRILGIPTVVDRMVQQAILQVLQPIYDPTFSAHSYGFRPGRGQHQAVVAARQYIADGYNVVVDVDIEKFFDRVNHDIMMGRLARKIGDKTLLRLIRRFLEAGMMADGVVQPKEEGTPQGGPLSPLLGNILLDEVDKELERRGHKFCRYADDCNVYVRSFSAGHRVLKGLEKLLGKLKLKTNKAKTAVARPSERRFLGFTFMDTKNHGVIITTAPASVEKLKDRIRALTSRNNGRNLKQTIAQLNVYMRGWMAYFSIARARAPIIAVGKLLRRRLRAHQLKQWKTPGRIYAKLRELGVDDRGARQVAKHPRQYTRMASNGALHTALNNKYLQQLGLLDLR